MPDFSKPRPPSERPPIRMLLLGHTGSGKTGSLCSLAAAGYNVRILDLDNGTQVIEDFMTNRERSIYLKAEPSGLWTQGQALGAPSRISYVTVTEKYKLQGARALPRGDAWQRMLTQLNDWKDGELRLGNIATWGPRDILVIDGLSRAFEAALNFQLALNGRLLKGPQVGTAGDNDYTHTYSKVSEWLDMMKSDEIKCHIILICHIRFIDENRDRETKETQRKGFPQTVGQRMAPQIGQYFNHTLRAKSVGNAPMVRRVIVTNNDEDIELKNSSPLRIKQEYKLETGLAEYFRTVLEQ